jgi:hypothetical protein
MTRVTLIQHAGKEIVFLDLANAKIADITAMIAEAAPVIRSRKPKSVLTLTDATNIAVAHFSNDEMSKFLSDNKPYVKAAAVIGLSSLARAVVSTLRIISGRQIAAFGERAAALRWLVEHP